MKRILFFIPLVLVVIALAPLINADAQKFEDPVVVLETIHGNLVIEFFQDDAPNHVENFLKLSQDGVYDGTYFHRIIFGFMIQGGDPKSATPGVSMSEWGTGDPGYTIDAEFNDISHERGIVSMARSNDPNSAGSQFFIVHKDSTFLDGEYTVFGRIITQESFDVLDKIAELETQLAELKAEQKEEQTYDSKSFREVIAKDIAEYIKNAEEAQLVELYNTFSDNEAVYNEESKNILVKTPETAEIIADAEKAEAPEEEVVQEKDRPEPSLNDLVKQDAESKDDEEDEEDDDKAGEVPMLDKEFDEGGEEVELPVEPVEDKFTNDLDPTEKK